MVGQQLRSNLARIGVDLRVRTQDFGEYVNRVYTRRDFDTVLEGANVGPDPSIGIQRFYWSRNFQPGVAFSNGSHYDSAEADRLLQAAQTENDPARRREVFARFQRRVQTDLPRIPILAPHGLIVHQRRVRGLPPIDAATSNLAGVWLAPNSSPA